MNAQQLFFLAVCVAAIVVGGQSRRVVRTTNVDTAYSRWNKTAIPYYLDSDFSSTEAAIVRGAIAQIMTDLAGCVTFTEVAPSAMVYKIKFTPLTGAAGSAEQTVCYSYPGVDIATRASAMEQIISIARGPTGCLDGTLRGIMKYIAIVLGKRNEHQRGDRDKYITVNNANLAIPAGYSPYTTSNALWTLFPYDYCSITHNQPTNYALAGVTAFSVVAGTLPGFIPYSDHISQTDCKLISMMYSCPSSACTQTTCAAITTTSTTTGSTTTNTASTTTNTASTTTNTASTTTNTASTTTNTASTTTNTASTTTGPSTTTNTASTTTGPSTTTDTASTTTGPSTTTNTASTTTGPSTTTNTASTSTGPSTTPASTSTGPSTTPASTSTTHTSSTSS